MLGQVLGGMTSQGGRGMPDLGAWGTGRWRRMGRTAAAAVDRRRGHGRDHRASALQLLQRNGGLEGVLGKLRQKGHGQEADSWVGTGVRTCRSTPDVLRRSSVAMKWSARRSRWASIPQEALGGLANVFPEIVNQITPQGRVETGSDDLVSRALQELQQKQS